MRIEVRNKVPTLEQLKNEEKNLIEELKIFKSMDDLELKKNMSKCLNLSNQLEQVQTEIKKL